MEIGTGPDKQQKVNSSLKTKKTKQEKQTNKQKKIGWDTLQ